MIKKLLTVFILCINLIFFSCESKKEAGTSTNVSQNQIETLTAHEKLNFKRSLIRHIGRKPEDASEENKFHAYFDAHYEKQVEGHTLTHYHKTDEKSYFVFTRIAPSIQLKKVAIGGYVTLDSDSSVLFIKEEFRTWKQIPDTLQIRTDLLFNKMVNGESLKPFYTENSGNMEYIEFPNNEVWYDTISFSWESSREDVIKEYMDAKVERTKEKIEAFENNLKN